MWTINDVMASAARKYGGRVAIVDGERRVSFSELEAEVGRTAAWMQAQGMRKGDKVAIQGRNSLAWATAFYAVLRTGAVAVPLNHKLAAAETTYILEHSESRFWLVEGSLYQQTVAIATPSNAPTAFALDPKGDKSVLPALAPHTEAGTGTSIDIGADDLAELLYTSGTTGRPKGCMHSHASALLAGIGSSMVFGLGQDDRVLIAMPIWHSFPLNNLLVSSLYFGACVVFMPEYHPRTFLQTIQAERCTLFFGAPIAYLMPLEKIPDFDEFDLSSVRAWLYGAGPIDAVSARVLMERYKSDRFYQLFGMTETGPTGTALLPDEQLAKAGSIGRCAVSGCDLKVMLDGGKIEAAPGENGEIWMRCQSMMKGYYRNPEATASAFRDGWYCTGDVAHIDEEGYLFIVDRLKDMVIIGGENVYSKEVEDVLAQHPAISEVAVIGMPDIAWGESLTAVIVPRAGETVDIDDVKTYCARYLARYKIPRLIRIIETMPRTPTGKVKKYMLRDATGTPGAG